MRAQRQFTTPLILRESSGTGSVVRLAPVDLKTSGEGAIDEARIQHLIQIYPDLLPIAEIEPAFLPIVPVCLELPTPKGFVDNFFVTPRGNLIFAECKLWRNPEARRQVVAQVMDYVESIAAWTYADLEAALGGGTLPPGVPRTKRLYELVSDVSDLDEPEFIDAVSRNLRRGRGLFLIVGDGIREEVESLAAHLQGHAGIHFALGLVELALFRLPDNSGTLIQPRVIARTVNIERGIVRIIEGRITVEADQTSGDSDRKRAESLSEEDFYECIATEDSDLPNCLRAFLDRIAPLGVVPEFKRTLILRWRAVDGSSFNLGYIHPNGETWTDAVSWPASKLGVLDIAHDYIRELAEAIGGEIEQVDEVNWYAKQGGHIPRVDQLLAHEDAWVGAIAQLTERINKRLEEISVA